MFLHHLLGQTGFCMFYVTFCSFTFKRLSSHPPLQALVGILMTTSAAFGETPVLLVAYALVWAKVRQSQV